MQLSYEIKCVEKNRYISVRLVTSRKIQCERENQGYTSGYFPL